MDLFYSRRFRKTPYSYACRVDSCASVEYHKFVFELEVALDRYTHSCCWHLDGWKQYRMGEGTGGDEVLHWMEIAIHCAWLQNHLLAVVWVIRILSCLCGYDGGECCVHLSKSLSLSSKDTGDKDPCIIKKNEMSQQDYEVSRRSFRELYYIQWAGHRKWLHLDEPFPKMEFYHSLRISDILHHRFARYGIDISLWTSFECRKSYHISIQHDTAMVLHPHQNLLPALSDLKLSLCLKCIPYMNRIFFLDTDSPLSSQVRKTRAQTNEWDMTEECALSWLCDELEPSVDWC